MADLKLFAKLAEKHIPHVWERRLSDLSETEVRALIMAAWSCPDAERATPPGGWGMPHLEKGRLIIGFECHPKYKWWEPGGQSLWRTLCEIDAPQEVIDVYVPEWAQHD